MSEYIEDFVSWIDVPLLDKVDITVFDQPVFSTPRLRDFLAPNKRNKHFKACSEGHMVFWGYSIEIRLGSLSLVTLGDSLNQEVWSMARLCGSSLNHPPLWNASTFA